MRYARDSDRCIRQRPSCPDDYFSKVLPPGRRRPPCRDTKQPREAHNPPQTADCINTTISNTKKYGNKEINVIEYAWVFMLIMIGK